MDYKGKSTWSKNQFLQHLKDPEVCEEEIGESREKLRSNFNKFTDSLAVLIQIGREEDFHKDEVRSFENQIKNAENEVIKLLKFAENLAREKLKNSD